MTGSANIIQSFFPYVIQGISIHLLTSVDVECLARRPRVIDTAHFEHVVDARCEVCQSHVVIGGGFQPANAVCLAHVASVRQGEIVHFSARNIRPPYHQLFLSKQLCEHHRLGRSSSCNEIARDKIKKQNDFLKVP